MEQQVTRPKVVWINGAFGVGKTTVGREIAKRLVNAMVFDPEKVGFMLAGSIPRELRKADFQSYPLWRELTVRTILGLMKHCGRDLVVPMTLVDLRYFDEILGELRRAGVEVHHFSLIASRRTIRRRLLCRLESPWSTKWAFGQIDRCVLALERPEFRKHFDAERNTAMQIVNELLKELSRAESEVDA